ncbi:hypothetical protein COCON_G00056610 [Conger conger]|uniref:Uncharacterized protein n=1 Tax=Conger conger TaxID=82655 RepID=A0A9Q1DQH1_CONCO|nr:hypothetical protein COCON_G00056610 [Conger conger]
MLNDLREYLTGTHHLKLITGPKLNHAFVGGGFSLTEGMEMVKMSECGSSIEYTVLWDSALRGWRRRGNLLTVPNFVCARPGHTVPRSTGQHACQELSCPPFPQERLSATPCASASYSPVAFKRHRA